MVKVVRNSEREPANSFLRRFNRRIQQAGVLATAKNNKYFTKPISRRERRLRAIRRSRRRVYRFVSFK